MENRKDTKKVNPKSLKEQIKITNKRLEEQISFSTRLHNENEDLKVENHSLKISDEECEIIINELQLINTGLHKEIEKQKNVIEFLLKEIKNEKN